MTTCRKEVRNYSNWENIYLKKSFGGVYRMAFWFTVSLGSGAERKIEDVMLSRYACHPIVQNADPKMDYMGSTELAANLFRATQTDEKLRRDRVLDKMNANQTHFEVGVKVRQRL